VRKVCTSVVRTRLRAVAVVLKVLTDGTKLIAVTVYVEVERSVMVWFCVKVFVGPVIVI
jgi:hypothetical protein